VLVPMKVPPRALAATVAGLRGIDNFAGAIVTMPHKIAVLGLLDRLSAAAERVGACNMIRRDDDGSLAGTILDGEGLVGGLHAAGQRVAGRRVLLLGAGGAATAIAFALCEHGVAALTIHNRTASAARALQQRLERHYPGLVDVTGHPAAAGHQIVINATSLGLRRDDDLPMAVHTLTAAMLAVDVVIKAEPTPFLAAAIQRGCAVQPGLPMLEAQLDLMLEFAGVGDGQ
jgi:shikimate dehydrogenase